MKRLIFKGKEYILVQFNPSVLSGAIATEEQYENFERSMYHLFEDGNIKSFGQIVGTIKDITWLEEEYE